MVDPSYERIAQLMTQFMRLLQTRPEAWRELDLTMTQLKALMFLRARQPLTIGKIGQALHVSLASASALVDRLARLGLVTRHEALSDRRQTIVRLDASGEAMLARLETDASARMRRIIEALSPEGRAAFTLALEEMIRVAQREDSVAVDAASGIEMPAPLVAPGGARA
jgi:DNA-binding MarR family transcriptional regulator